ncbi:MAG: T9SS type A sorting domain-containing protein [Saprospiraceae bacterium]|nr:T9SS type A sorting domain-containing protein [Saprospiraceae bacterium]
MQSLSLRLSAGLLFFSLFLQAQGFNVHIQVTQDIACFGSNEGELSAVVTPAGAAYSFSWSNGQTTSVAGGLTAGAYSVTVQSASGAIVVASAVLSQPDALVLTPITELPLAIDSMGAVEVETYGGVAPYAYQWFDQQAQIFSETEDLANAPAGVYSLTASDAHGCTAELNPVVLMETSGNKELINDKAQLYPNPAMGEVVLEIPTGKETSVQIFSLNGKLMFSALLQDTRNRISVAQFPPSVYQVQLSGMNKTLRLLVL